MKFGSNDISAVKLGTQTVSAVYVGSNKIYPAATAYTAPAYVESGIQLYYNPEDPDSYSGTGTTINDLSGNGFDGTLYNSPTYDTNSFLYDGVDDYILTPNMYSAFGSTLHFTLEIWYKPTWTLQGQGGTVVSEVSPPDYTGWHYAMIEHRKAPFGSLAYDYAGIWTGSMTPVNPNLTTSGWRQITLTYDGTNGVSYTNASSPKTVALTRWAPWERGGASAYYLTFGHGDSTGQNATSSIYFKGNIGVVRVYNRALTATEVLANYNSTKAIYGLA